MRDNQQLTIAIPKSQNLRLRDTFFFIGSCFSTEISSRLSERLIPSESNPFGVVFNPLTILNQLKYIFSEDEINLGLIQHDDKWHALNLSNKFQSTNKEVLINQISQIAHSIKDYLIKADHIIITLGTSFIWNHNKLNSSIGNCHRIPQSEFTKRSLSFVELCDCFRSIISILTKHTNASLTFTVSPVRYLRDGILNNSVSKSLLRSSIQEILEKMKPCNISLLMKFSQKNSRIIDTTRRTLLTQTIGHQNIFYLGGLKLSLTIISDNISLNHKFSSTLRITAQTILQKNKGQSGLKK